MTIRNRDDWWAVMDAAYHNFIMGDGTIQMVYGAGDKSADVTLALAKAYEDRDSDKIVEVLNAIWFDAPDHPIIHTYPSWSALCDLCSESWVFDPEDDTERESNFDKAVRESF